MNKKDLMKVGVGVGVLALLYFAFKKKPTTASASFDSILSEERTSGSNSRIKPTSVSGLVVAKRPRNYGTAQRPTRKLTPISVRTGDGMDFDGNEDALGNVM
jgi:hypothetical protein